MTTFNLPPTSRYFGLEVVTMERADGTPVPYLRRRFLPPPERFSLLQEHLVNEGDRPDLIAGQYLGDPEAFWRIADANGVMRAEQLTATVGLRIRITLPEGIPGMPDA